MANEIASALADNAEIVAEAILGEPSHRGREENRWGSRGSQAVRIKGPRRGLWFDHERGEGGDAIDLIARERGTRRRPRPNSAASLSYVRQQPWITPGILWLISGFTGVFAAQLGAPTSR
jgi:hypothetical protein